MSTGRRPLVRTNLSTNGPETNVPDNSSSAFELAVAEDYVTLRVGGRDFYAARTTLCRESELFDNIFSEGVIPPSNGVYRLDRDPEAFHHILTYCRTQRYPLLYNAAEGSDFAMYDRLLAESSFYCMTKLTSWIKAEKYKGAIEVVSKPIMVSALVDKSEEREQRLTGGTKYIYTGPTKTITKVFVCPRDVFAHNSSWKCGEKCDRAGKNGSVNFKEVESHWNTFLVLTTKVRHEVLDATR